MTDLESSLYNNAAIIQFARSAVRRLNGPKHQPVPIAKTGSELRVPPDQMESPGAIARALNSLSSYVIERDKSSEIRIETLLTAIEQLEAMFAAHQGELAAYRGETSRLERLISDSNSEAAAAWRQMSDDLLSRFEVVVRRAITDLTDAQRDLDAAIIRARALSVTLDATGLSQPAAATPSGDAG